MKSIFPTLNDLNIAENYVSDILRNEDGYYIIKILDVDNSIIKNQKVKIAVIKVESLNLNDYLQKQYNNIKIREYIN